MTFGTGALHLCYSKTYCVLLVKAIDDGMILTYLPSLEKKLMQFEKAGAKARLIVNCLFQFDKGDQESLRSVNNIS